MHPNQKFIQGLANLQSGNLSEAVNLFKKSLEIDKNFDTYLLLGTVLAQLSKFQDAKVFLLQANAIDPNNQSCQFNLAKVFLELDLPEESLSYFQKVLKSSPTNFDAQIGVAICLSRLTRMDDALSYLDTIKNHFLSTPIFHLTKGEIFLKLKKFRESRESFVKAIDLASSFFPAFKFLGDLCFLEANYDQALRHYDEALRLRPDYPEAWSNKGLTLHSLKQYDEALRHYDEALRLRPDYPEAWSNKGLTLHSLKQYDEALRHCDEALRLRPDYPEAWSNKGLTLLNNLALDESILCLNKAILLSNKGFAEPFCNLCLAYLEKKEIGLARDAIDCAINFDPNLAQAWANKGLVLNEQGHLEEALICFKKALSLDQNLNFVLGCIINTQLSVGEWDGLSEKIKLLSEKIITGVDFCAPFQLLSITDSNEIQLANSKKSFSEALEKNRFGLYHPKRSNQRIKIGYVSPDLREHPVGILITNLLENHNRDIFEIHAFSLKKSNDPIQKRIRKSVDFFYDVSALSDTNLISLIHSKQIDIAIDLGGYTKGSKTNIFAKGIAPVQINFLGYAGTIGHSCMDYLIADSYVIPDHQEVFFTEKVLKLPHFYMPLDISIRQHRLAVKKLDYSLPDDKFIFCCFNNAYKMNASMVKLWSSILYKCENSVFWVPKHSDIFFNNLINEFKRNGIEQTRIIPAVRTKSNIEHISRLGLADLFLDTFPYSAHATAVDCFLAGLPLLSLCGDSFASRVSSSLLNTLKLDDLIAHSETNYIEKACALYNNRNELDALKTSFHDSIDLPWFSIENYSRQFDSILLSVFKQHS
jgi:protein O-GlcNAc transferase